MRRGDNRETVAHSHRPAPLTPGLRFAIESQFNNSNVRVSVKPRADGGFEFICNPYGFFHKAASGIARAPFLSRLGSAKAERENAEKTNKDLVAAIQSVLGEREAMMVRKKLRLDTKPNRVLTGREVASALKIAGAYSPHVSADLVSNAADVRSSSSSNDATSFAEICTMLNSHCPKDSVLLLRVGSNGRFFYFEDSKKVKESPELHERAMMASNELANIPEVMSYVTRHTQGKSMAVRALVTAETLSSVRSAMANNLRATYRAIGPSTHDREACRTPTEVTMHWIAELQKAQNYPASKASIFDLHQRQKQRWMSHQMTVEATRASLLEDKATLEAAGHVELAKTASQLAGQLPLRTEDLPMTRAHDNIYGRAFESKWIAGLVDSPPPRVLKEIQKTGRGVADMLRELPPADRTKVMSALQAQVVNDKRFWFSALPGMHDLAVWKGDRLYEKLLNILDAAPSNGVGALAVPYLTVKLFNAYNIAKVDAARQPWMQDATALYEKHICSQNGRIKEDKQLMDRNVPPETTAGVTLRHQPGAVLLPTMKATDRPSIHARILTDLDRNAPTTSVHVPKAVTTALSSGIPYANGTSGSTNIMLAVVNHLNSQGKKIDIKEALLGTMMFLNYDGGHSIHEPLWTANLLSQQIGLDLSAPANIGSFEPVEFVSDYRKFIDLYKNSDSHEFLEKSLENSWQETIRYFEMNSAARKGVAFPSPGTSEPLAV